MEETGVDDHKRFKKELKPPLSTIPNMAHSSWIHERLPDMLWAVLIVGNLERENALDFFRYVGKYIEKHKEFAVITLTGISNQDEQQIREFIRYLLRYSDDIKDILRPLILYPKLPALKIWKEFLDKPIPEEDWGKVSKGILETFDHQSEKATDCRWIKLLCFMIGGKLKFNLEQKEKVKTIFEYPKRGNLREVRPSIRALEIGMAVIKNSSSSWNNDFWDYNYNSVACMPEESITNNLKGKEEKLNNEIKNQKEYYLREIKKVRDKLVYHFFNSSKTTQIDSRVENSFGLSLYGLALMTEIIVYCVSSSVIGRIALRALIENYISFKYLLKKEKDENVWDDFHSYGRGQIKLIYLKLKELSNQNKCVNLDKLKAIANEDRWIEFVPINLGHWGNTNLRKMAEFAGVKEVYDMYYNYTSGFVHGTGGAIRESIYQQCLNPLHRFHRIPSFCHPLMESVLEDSVKIVNEILDCLNEAYPSFTERINLCS